MDEFRHGTEAVGLGEAVAALSAAANLDEFVGSALAECQRVLAGFGRSVADQKGSVGRVLHQIVDFFARDIAPIPIGFAHWAQVRLGSRRTHRRTGVGRRLRRWSEMVSRRQSGRRSEFRHRFAPIASKQKQFQDPDVSLCVMDHLAVKCQTTTKNKQKGIIINE